MAGEERDPYRIDWFRTLGGALAAVSSAVLLSTLGAAGTIIGAALGSVIASVAGNVYASGLARSRERMAAQTAALRRVGVAQAEVRRAQRIEDEQASEAHLEHADSQLSDAQAELDDRDRPSWRDRLAGLSWKRVALLAAGFFVVAAIAITAFELIAGKPVSDYTGGSDSQSGTSWTHLEGDRATKRTPRDKPSSTPTPSEEPTDATPTARPTQATPTPSAPPTTTPTPSQEPTQAPTQEPEPTAGEPSPGEATEAP